MSQRTSHAGGHAGGHAAKEPAVVARYFGATNRDHAIVAEVYRPETGWRRYPMRKRISASWARKMLADGIVAVTLAADHRRADFQVIELVK